MNLLLLKLNTIILSLFLLISLQTFAQFPYTDPGNTGGWTLNTEISDEFTDATLNESKWLIQGRNGVYQSNFIGRAPSQFSTNNVRIEDQKLKLQAKWDPTFAFSTTTKDGYTFGKAKTTDATLTCPVTTAAVIAKKSFLYGYMEIKCKAINTSVTSSFWATGSNTELDIFEHLGKPSLPNKTQLETEIWSSIHDWTKASPNSVWTDRIQLPFRVASGFHTYGADWDATSLKIYVDGVLIRTVTKTEVENGAAAISLGSVGWVITKPLFIWFDSEIFPWHGLPAEADLPGDYEIEYFRVWQKNTTSIKNQDANNENLNVVVNECSKTVQISLDANLTTTLTLMDLSAKTLFKNNYANKERIEINYLELNSKPGVYLLKIQNSSFSKTEKIILK